jgi:hypothetical protein
MRQVSQRSIFMVGQNSRGHWVVRDQNGTRGGLFISRDAALRYIRFENGNQPCPTIMVSGMFELDIGRSGKMSPVREPINMVERERRVA